MTADTTVFTYGNGMSYMDFSNTQFVPVFEVVCTPEEEQWVNDNCGGSTQCHYDYCVTKDADVALSTMQTQTNYVNSLLTMSK